MGLIWFIIFMVGLFALMYFMTIRPQKKEQRRQMELINTLAIDERIVTFSGIIGVVSEIKDHTVVIKTHNVHIEIMKEAINRRLDF